MVEKPHIDKLLARLPAIEAELSAPGTAANQKRFRELVREHSNLRKLQEKAARCFDLVKTLREHREMIADPAADPELKELARSEIADLEKALPPAELDLTVSLLPPDPAANQQRCQQEYRAKGWTGPIVPTGAAYDEWARTSSLFFPKLRRIPRRNFNITFYFQNREYRVIFFCLLVVLVFIFKYLRAVYRK
jgi:hypothetical protein